MQGNNDWYAKNFVTDHLYRLLYNKIGVIKHVSPYPLEIFLANRQGWDHLGNEIRIINQISEQYEIFNIFGNNIHYHV